MSCSDRRHKTGEGPKAQHYRIGTNNNQLHCTRTPMGSNKQQHSCEGTSATLVMPPRPY